jgi:flagellar export protein FliJ
MPGFAFRLQSVLEYRTGLVDRARQDLVTLQARLREEEAALVALRHAERQALRRLGSAHASATLDLVEITQLLSYGEMLANQIVQQQQVIERCREVVDAQQQQVIALAKDAKALEKLRERQLEEYQQEDARRERVETSEIASTRHQRLQDAGS